MNRFLALLAGAAIVVLAPAAASAQPAAVAQAADSAKLAEAHAIIAIMFPPAQLNKMTDDMLTNISAPLRKNLPFQSIPDPGLKKLVADFADEAIAQERPMLQKHMPQILEAMASAYTREFSLAELKDIHAFAQTPSGTRYFSRMTAILGDPAVAHVNAEIMADAQAMTLAKVAEFKEKLEAYLKAHPDVAAQLKAGNAGS